MEPYYLSNDTKAYLKNSTYNAAVNLIYNVSTLEGGWGQFVKNMGVGFGFMRANTDKGVVASAGWGTYGALQYWRIGTLKRIKELNRVVVLDNVGQGFGLPPINQWASKLVEQMGLTEEQMKSLGEYMQSFMQGAQSVPTNAPRLTDESQPPDRADESMLYLPEPIRV